MSNAQYHINLATKDIGKYILMPGDPGRVKKIATFLDESHFVKRHREYTTYQGYLSGERVTVISSGMGGPSTAIAVEELKRIGAHTIIRIGTCGSIQTNIKNGSIIVPYGVFRGGRTALEYLPAEYPAVAHPDVFQALVKSAQSTSATVYTGITHCKDAFFKEEPEEMPDTQGVRNYWHMLRKSNVLSSDMETDTLFVLCSIRGLRAGAVFSAVGAVETTPVIAKKGISNAIHVAVQAMNILIKNDQK